MFTKTQPEIDCSETPSLDNSCLSLNEGWFRARSRLRAELGEEVFTSWFGRLELERLDEGGVAFFSVPTRFLQSWIQSHYGERILLSLSFEVPSVRAVRFGQRPTHSPAGRSSPGVECAKAVSQSTKHVPAAQETPSTAATLPMRHPSGGSQSNGAAEIADGFVGSPLDARLTFDTFLVGRSNQLAYTAAERIVKTSEISSLKCNPLYIHAAVGLGKTHLLQAVAHAARENALRAIYLTAEKFMYGFVAALKTQTAIAFKERLRGIDVLLIDDIQFLQGKSIQTEFCHTLNALIDAGRQIVIAADRPPGDLESLDERVRSRLAGGVCLEMGLLDEAVRTKILETRIATAQSCQHGFEVSRAVVAYVAQTLATNGRDLDGAVNRLVAHATLTGMPLTLETAEVAIRDLVRTREPKRPKIEDIQKLVAGHYNVSRADILSSRRTANVVLPRQIAMYLSKVVTMRSLPEIGRRFGGRDHTTVLHAVRKIDGLTKVNTSLSEEIDLLKRTLLE